MFKLLSTANPKIQKGTQRGYLSFILHLAPADLSGRETCPKRTPGCTSACLNTAGRGGMFKRGETTNVIQRARIRKTQYFFHNREAFMGDLVSDIMKAVNYARRKGLTPVFRLNGTSDLSWEKYATPYGSDNIFTQFPTLQFYDYTKVLGRKVSHLSNYHLTFSKADGNDADVAEALMQGMSVVAVYDAIPAGVPSADLDDLRFLDPRGIMLGLKAKGRAKKDYSGFVIRVKETA
ncbi:MAG: hypothetical protein JW384_00402 [Nitrosomonadaceae bacterium]|nr:hypothetical protein [Nitrosomonadaceae bacterium]